MFKFQPSKHEVEDMASTGTIVSNYFQFENNWTVSCSHYENGADPKYYPFPKRFEVMILHNCIPKKVFKETTGTNVIHVSTVAGINNILEQIDKISKWNHSKGDES